MAGNEVGLVRGGLNPVSYNASQASAFSDLVQGDCREVIVPTNVADRMGEDVDLNGACEATVPGTFNLQGIVGGIKNAFESNGTYISMALQTVAGGFNRVRCINPGRWPEAVGERMMSLFGSSTVQTVVPEGSPIVGCSGKALKG